MSDLKRWTFVGIDGMSAPEATEHWRETPDGKWVDYEDVAALKEENERLLRRMGAVEMKAHLQTIDERDKAEETLSQAYYLITGRSPEWSNLFGHEQALEDIDDAQKCLRASIAALEAQVARLARPLTHKEWKKHFILNATDDVYAEDKDGFDGAIRARKESLHEPADQ